MKTIELTQNQCALVDDEDFDWLSKINWHYQLYAVSNKGKYMHITILEYHKIEIPKGHEIDHKDQNELNNQKYNLRVITHSQNIFNVKLRNNNTSGVRGVYFETKKNKWYSKIEVNYKHIHLGYYEKFEDAVNARQRAERRYFKEVL